MAMCLRILPVGPRLMMEVSKHAKADAVEDHKMRGCCTCRTAPVWKFEAILCYDWSILYY